MFVSVSGDDLRTTFANYTATTEYEVIRELGGGGQGRVYAVRPVGTAKSGEEGGASGADGQAAPAQTLLAMKVMPTGSELAVWKALFECEILRQLNSPYIVAFEDAFVREPPSPTAKGLEVCLVMEMCSGGDLFDVFAARANDAAPFTQTELGGWMAQIASALHHLHSQTFTDPRPNKSGKAKAPGPLIYRDLKPENLFVTTASAAESGSERYVLKLGDFGISRVAWDKADDANGIERVDTTSGSLSYLAPEALAGATTLTPAVDIFALGVMMFYMARMDMTPNVGMLGLRPGFDPVASLRPLLVSGARSELDEPFIDLIIRCVKAAPEDRPSAAELLASPVLAPYVADLAADPMTARVVKARPDAREAISASVRDHFRRQHYAVARITLLSASKARIDSPSKAAGKCFRATVRHSESSREPRFDLAFDIQLGTRLGRDGFQLVIDASSVVELAIPPRRRPTLLVRTDDEPSLVRAAGRSKKFVPWDSFSLDGGNAAVAAAASAAAASVAAEDGSDAAPPPARTLRSTPQRRAKARSRIPATPNTKRRVAQWTVNSDGTYEVLVTFASMLGLERFLHNLAMVAREPTEVFHAAQATIIDLVTPLLSRPRSISPDSDDDAETSSDAGSASPTHCPRRTPAGQPDCGNDHDLDHDDDDDEADGGSLEDLTGLMRKLKF
ncbi:serine/threonine protein kinase [Thecamonas trahens ATCC 50062]|uniref:Serine/threonine protein kinase n=1 Tax=Thecamonas trahens ATCC 50062 TaxID=461836 RepID=A0A0L0D7Q3_THETB|nr:serine/threonine protein kinase [Thecamonas trahens ATCC 50062]KNC48086.1 serine/threonine protein kinase [Thecamonas trahens ATCC 50062]|eukprot:XP_013759099.1 serine/threonine protein kinase [Thecamonas trahens ATCC 50062]